MTLTAKGIELTQVTPELPDVNFQFAVKIRSKDFGYFYLLKIKDHWYFSISETPKSFPMLKTRRVADLYFRIGGGLVVRFAAQQGIKRLYFMHKVGDPKIQNMFDAMKTKFIGVAGGYEIFSKEVNICRYQ